MSRRLLLAFLAGLSLLLLSCGGGSGDISATRQPVVAAAATGLDANTLMNWAESQYPSLFPGPSPTLTLAPYTYRAYALPGGKTNYVGVTGDGSVYVLSPDLNGGQLWLVGTLSDFTCRVLGCPAATTSTNFFVDDPAYGLDYACAPSNRVGRTGADGAFTCYTTDQTVTFTIAAGGGVITLGQMAIPAAPAGVSYSVPVTDLHLNGLNDGLPAAEILHALDHGGNGVMDLSGLSMSPALVAAVNAYLASGGTQLGGQPSDDQFLASLQAGTSFTSALLALPAFSHFVRPVTGTTTTFVRNTVMPHLNDSITSISNPPPLPPTAQTTSLNGTIVVGGAGAIPAQPGCDNGGNWTASGGGVLNAIVTGNMQQPGVYPIGLASPNFAAVISVNCPGGDASGDIVVPAPLAGNGTVTVTAGFAQNNLAFNVAVNAPDGCVAGNLVGSDVGLSNPMVTLNTAANCNLLGVAGAVGVTAKLVGAP